MYVVGDATSGGRGACTPGLTMIIYTHRMSTVDHPLWTGTPYPYHVLVDHAVGGDHTHPDPPRPHRARIRRRTVHEHPRPPPVTHPTRCSVEPRRPRIRQDDRAVQLQHRSQDTRRDRLGRLPAYPCPVLSESVGGSPRRVGPRIPD